MKILIVTQYFWPENFRVNDLAVAIKARGHEVTVVTGMPNYPKGAFFEGYGWFKRWREDYRGMRVVRIPLIPRGSGGSLRLAMNYLSFSILASLIAPFRCRGKYNVIFVFEPSPITVGLPAIVLRKIKKIPIVFWVLDMWPDSLSATGAVKSPVAIAWVTRLTRYIFRHCDLILAQSRSFLPRLVELDVAAEKCRYFPSWAESLYEEGVGPHAAPLAVPDLPRGFRIVFAGNIGVAQDFTAILDAAEQLQRHADIHWIIVGDGRRSDWVAEQVRERGLESAVHLLGRFPLEAMPSFFVAADALLVTLKRDPVFALTIPGKVQSYLAAGRPILAMLDGEGARVIEESGAGLACAAGDAAGLANAVLKMRQMTAGERETMGSRGKTYYRQHFDRAMLFDKLETWFRSLNESEFYEISREES